jgi:replicative superfamily II helicase
MEWHPIQRTTESEFSEAATAKMLEGWIKEGDINAIYNAALLLNTCLHQQRTMTKWLAGEAARNLGKPELENDIMQDAILKSDQS